MFRMKLPGWSVLATFVVAAALLVLLVLLTRSLALNFQAMLLASGVSALVAAILGFYAFTTSPGKVGAIGGHVLFIAVAILLSFTITACVERSGAQLLPMARVAVRGAEPSFTAGEADDGLRPQ